MTLKIGILEGDDIGLEVVPECVKVMKAAAARAGLAVAWEPIPIARRAHEQYGHTMPPGTLESLDRLDGWVLGPIGHREYPRNDPTWVNAHPVLRTHFQFYANYKPFRSYPNIPSLHENVDMLFLRETTEGFKVDANLYKGYGEFQPTEDVAIGICVTTRTKSRLIAEAAFEAARARPRRKVSAVHKNTVYRMGDGLFADECRKIAAQFPDVEFEEVIVDTCALRLVMNPQQYDVLVTTNLYGDILTDEAAGLVGGLGLAPGLNAGERHAMAQATHGSAPDIAGKGIANPYAMIMSGKMLYEWLARRRNEPKAAEAARHIETAVERVIAEARHLTRDLGGRASTAQMGDAIAAAI
ncbi:MAG: isocitrate/isopropylmalate dehydrogenase family protein [Betaproteobacteria bacterium]